MYESVVESAYYLVGKYTDARDHVVEDANNFLNYALNREDIDLHDYLMYGGSGYMMFLADGFKNLFNDYDESENIDENYDLDNFDFSIYDEYFFVNSNFDLQPLSGVSYKLSFTGWTYPGGTYNEVRHVMESSGNIKFNFETHHKEGYRVTLYYPSDVQGYHIYHDLSSDLTSLYNRMRDNKSVSDYIRFIYRSGGSIVIYKDDKTLPSPSKNINKPIVRNINNYIQDGGLDNKQMLIPEVQPYLSCSQNGRIDLTIIGSNFHLLDGTQIPVSYDGVASLNGENCTLQWDKPVYEYVGDSVVQVIGDDMTDVETGQKIGDNDDNNNEESPGDCEGISCFLSGAFVGILVTKLLDGLKNLLVSLFMPSEHFFDSFKNLKNTWEEKTGVNDLVNSVDELNSSGGGKFDDFVVSLMGVDNLVIVDSSVVNSALDTIHSWVRGFFYPLLLFFNINMIYRMIRGTSLIGIGSNKKGDS